MAYTDAQRKAIQDSRQRADKSQGLRVGDPVCLCYGYLMGCRTYTTAYIEALKGKYVLCCEEHDGLVRRRWQVPRRRLRYSEYTIKSTGIVIREWRVDCPPPEEVTDSELLHVWAATT